MATRDNIFLGESLVSGIDYYPLLSLGSSGLNQSGVDSQFKYQGGVLSVPSIDTLTINGLPASQFDTTNVKYWGAVGNGIADDTASILLAIANNTRKVYFPEGTYLISDTIAITNKPDLAVEGDGATILMSVDAKPAMQLLTSPRASIYGSFIFKATAVFSNASSCAIRTQQSDGFIIQGVVVDGEYVFGNPATIRFPKGIRIGANGGGGTGFAIASLDSVVVKGCKTGIEVSGEYHNFNNCQVSYCSEYGITIINTGNNSINGGQYIYNRIGLYVDSNNAGNGDHGKCVGATFNHNVACGVFVKRTAYSWLMSGCDVWASIGDLNGAGFTPATLTEAGAVGAQTKCFGLYCQDVENLNLTGCSLSRNRINVGYDGLVTSVISSNSFLSDNTRTEGHIVEYGNGHSTFNYNAQNVITSNCFYAPFVAPYTANPNIVFLTNDRSIAEVVANNMGTTMVPPYTTAGRLIDADGTYLIDGNTQFTTINGARTLTLSMGSSTAGNPIVISFYNVVSQVITLNSTSTNVPIISGTGVTYNSGTKQFTFTKNGSFVFTPYGGTYNNWFIQCPIEAP